MSERDSSMTTPKADATAEQACGMGAHRWPDDAAEGDTCDCGMWYRFRDRIEMTPEIDADFGASDAH